MTNVQQLRKQSPPSRTPQRQALADAIAAHTEAEQHLAAIKQALESSTSAIFAAERAVKAAESAIEEAKKNAATHLVATMLNTAGTPPITVKAARSTLLDEQDQLDAASDAKIALEREERSAREHAGNRPYDAE